MGSYNSTRGSAANSEDLTMSLRRLSAAAYPVVLFGGVHLPAILPQSDSLHALLWDAHFYLAFVFFALILLHVAAALFHALVRRDGVFEAMASVSTHDEVAPAE